MRILFSTGSAPQYMAPPQLADEQINCGPFWPDQQVDGRVVSLATPQGEYDLAAVAARLPAGQQPDAVVCLVDASWINRPKNLAAFKCPKVVLVADTHHLNNPITSMLDYVAAEAFDRVVLLYDRHHGAFFRQASPRDLYWFPGLTFPHADATVAAAIRGAKAAPRIGFAGQASKFHPRRGRLLEVLRGAQLPLVQRQMPQSETLRFYAESLLGFNCSLNGDLNLRCFEVLAAGGLLLTDALGAGSGLEELQAQGCDLVTYRSEAELCEVAAHWLAHPDEARARAEKGRRWFETVFNAKRRQAMFQSLVFDGTAPEPFARPGREPAGISFASPRDLMMHAAVYEGVQEMHRVKEQPAVVMSRDVAPAFAALCTTLPRLKVNSTDCASAELAVLTRADLESPSLPQADFLWCPEVEAESHEEVAGLVARGGYVAKVAQVPFFMRLAKADDRLELAAAALKANTFAVAAGLIQSVLGPEPQHVGALLLAAKLALAINDAELGEEVLGILQQVAPQHPDLPPLIQALAGDDRPAAGGDPRLTEVQRAFEAGQLQEAILQAYTLTQENPQCERAWQILTQAFIKLGRHGDALKTVQYCLALAPGQARHWFDRSWLLARLDREAEALNAAWQATRLEPDRAEYQQHLAELGLRMRLPEVAAAALAAVDATAAPQLRERLAKLRTEIAGAPDEDYDLLVTHIEICRLHGTGVLLERYFGGGDRLISLRGRSLYEGRSDLPAKCLTLSLPDLSAEEERHILQLLLASFKIRRILSIPYYVEDVRRTRLVREITGAPLCVYVMDDQTVHATGLKPEEFKPLLAAADLRLVISPEMRAAYESTFGLSFEVMPPLLTSARGRLANKWQPRGHQPAAAALVGNIWSAQQFQQVREFVRRSGLRVDWFGNNKARWLPADPKDYEADGIFARGFLAENELARQLVQYPFVIIPSGKLDGTEDNEWLTRLSLPSRMVFILGQAMTPMLVLGHAKTAASRFVEEFGLGLVVPYDEPDPRRAVAPLLDPGRRQGFMARIAACADQLVLPDAGSWIWSSLEAGRALPAPFHALYPVSQSGPAVKDFGPVRRPTTLNLQAIDICNSRCIMCHVWKDGVRDTMSLTELRTYLRNPFFSEVRHVGITGGEPTLRKDLVELYRLLPECLPALTGASFISHGLQTARAVECYTKVNQYYRRRGLEFSGMISLDGVNEVHDAVRGRPGAFAAASRTLLELKRAGVNVIAACTIVRRNVYGLHDLLAWGRQHGVYVRFRVAEFIRRLYNDGCAPEIRAFESHELRHLVCFFHVLLTEYERDATIRRTYQSIVELLTGGERLIGCPYQQGAAVNINSRGELAACAPKGDSLVYTGDDEATHAALTAQRETIAHAHCARCIHDYHDHWNATAMAREAAAEQAQRRIYDRPDNELTAAEVPVQPVNWADLRRMLLVGWYGTETAGDIAILQGIITEYLAENPALQFGVLSIHPAYTRTSIAAWPEELRSRVTVEDFLSQAALEAGTRYDAIVMAGGPLMDIPDTRKILALFKLFAEHGKPRLIEGCGVGPLNRTDLRWNVCRIARLATRITVRDYASRDYLRLLGLRKPIAVRADPAETFLRSLDLKHTGTDRGVIRCFLRELTSEYPQGITPEEATAALAQFLANLLAWYPQHRVELWAMHHFPVGNDDRLFARELQRRVDDARLTVQWQPGTPEEIATAMAAAEFCVCMRFHSCVFAAAVGAPFVAIDYTGGGKIRALLEERAQEHRLCRLDQLARVGSREFAAMIGNPVSSQQTPAVAGPQVLHVIQGLTGGGGARALISLARHSRAAGGPAHAVVSLQAADSKGLELARAAGVPVLDQPGAGALHRALAAADIVLVHWWNCPELSVFFRRDLPPMRLAMWVHVGGYHPPYLLQPELVDFVDSAIACSPHTFAHPAFASRGEATDPRRNTMILAGADFDRLAGLTLRPHAGFRIGYIGTLDPTKMHPDYMAMSCAAEIPDVRFVVCGSGRIEWLTDDCRERGREESFEFTGPVENIRSLLEGLDVYGYPLCEDTYAAAELNVQEAMYAGLPVVAFPYGGLASLIQDGETGLLVNSADEYARALEWLYAHPEERVRLGANAAAYARQHFGAERTGREFNRHFDWLLQQPKRTRQWGVEPAMPAPVAMPDELAAYPGARLFLESIGPAAGDFVASLQAPTVQEQLGAEQQIGHQTLLTHYTCAYHYRKVFAGDPLLNHWAGIGFLSRSQPQPALDGFQRALAAGFAHWRMHWYCARAAEAARDWPAAQMAVQRLLQAVPELPQAHEMQRRIAALAAAEEATHRDPIARAEHYALQAQNYLRNNQAVEGREALAQAARLVPENLQILELLADLDCRLGNLTSARALLEQILAQDPRRKTPRLAAIRQACESLVTVG